MTDRSAPPNAEQVKAAAEAIRDEWTAWTNASGVRRALIYPLAMDVLARTPALCCALADRLAALAKAPQ